MLRRSIQGALLAASAWSCAAVAQPPAPLSQPSAPGQPQVAKQIKPGLFMITGAGGNSTVLVTEHGLLLVDDKLAGQTNFDALVAAARGISTLPVLAVFNTHHHADHSGNNDRFLQAGVMVIGADGIDRLLANGGFAGRTPNILYTKDFSLVMMRGRTDAHHYGPGHTSADTVVHFPAARAIAAGDLLVASTPNFDYAGGASIDGWIDTIGQMLKLDFDTAVPGHGDAAMSRADVERFRTRLITFRDRARAAVAAGATRGDLISRIDVRDLGWSWSATAWPAAKVEGLWREAGGAR